MAGPARDLEPVERKMSRILSFVRRTPTAPAADGGAALDALRSGSAFQRQTDAGTAIATLFCVEAEQVIARPDRVRAAGVSLPVHVGVAGPAKLRAMLRFAMACGIGPSMHVLQRRASDLKKLMLPFKDSIATAGYTGVLTVRPQRARE
jgi:methylenetetrahydrofolate reductase (NADPH)